MFSLEIDLKWFRGDLIPIKIADAVAKSYNGTITNVSKTFQGTIQQQL